MLYQGANGSSQDFPVVHLSLPARFMAAELLGAFDDGSDGNIDPFLPQSISQCRVVVAGDGQVGILDDFLLVHQSLLDFRFHFR